MNRPVCRRIDFRPCSRSDHARAQRLVAGLFPLHEAFMASVETEDPETGETMTWGELLERHGTGGPGGLKLLPAGHDAPVLEAEVWEVSYE